MSRLKLRGRGKYWYRIYHYICPICKSDDISKRRIYTVPKPDEELDRHEYRDAYCGCNESEGILSDSFESDDETEIDFSANLSVDPWEDSEIIWDSETKSLFED